MRTIRVNERRSGHTWLWIAAGAAAGVALGVIIAEKRSGRKLTLRGLVARGRGIADSVVENVGPLVETALALKESWSAAREADEEDLDEEDLDGELDGEDDSDDEDLDDDDLDDDADEEDEEDEEDEDEDDEDEDDEADFPPEPAPLDARVLEAFSHDPILSARAVEIEDVGRGDIILHGRVRDPREIRHAVTMARGVPGVTRVREQLVVFRKKRR